MHCFAFVIVPIVAIVAGAAVAAVAIMAAMMFVVSVMFVMMLPLLLIVIIMIIAGRMAGAARHLQELLLCQFLHENILSWCNFFRKHGSYPFTMFIEFTK
jgi:hypothetical protein